MTSSSWKDIIKLAAVLTLLGHVSFGVAMHAGAAQIGVALGDAIRAEVECPCANKAFCKPTNSKAHAPHEVVVFSVNNPSADSYKVWNWNNITTVISEGYTNPQLMCHTHSQGAKYGVKVAIDISDPAVSNQTGTVFWVTDQVNSAFKNGADIIHLVPVGPVSRNQSEIVTHIVKLFQHAVDHMGIKLTIEFPWLPICYDGVCLEHEEIAENVHFVIVNTSLMHAYHTIPGWACVARSHSAFSKILSGIDNYMSLGLPPSKLIFSVPWVAYDYTCTSFDKHTNSCHIEPSSHYGNNCTFYSGNQLMLHDVVDLQMKYNTTEVFHTGSRSPYLLYKDNKGQQHQLWFENWQSTTEKFIYAKQASLRGISIWHVDGLNYTTSAPKQLELNVDMWSAVSIYEKEDSYSIWHPNLAGAVAGISVAMLLVGVLVGTVLGVWLEHYRMQKRQKKMNEEERAALTEMEETAEEVTPTENNINHNHA